MGAKEYKLFSVIKPNRLFDNIPESQLSFKISQKDFVNFEEGDIIFQSGDQAEVIYLIVEGRVKIKYNANVDGQRYFEKSDQEFFGEREFIQGITRTSSAVAETPVKAFIFTKDVINQLIEKNPALLHNLQAIDPLKDVARFGMTTHFQSDEFDALMRSVRQSAGGDPYSTTESMGIMPDSASDTSVDYPVENERGAETVEISGQPDDDPSSFNSHFTMEILDPSEGSSYTVTDNTFSNNDDFAFPGKMAGEDDVFTVNPDLFKTGVESSFVFSGSETPAPNDETNETFDFELLHSLPDDALPLPENNIYDDIYGDKPFGNESSSLPSESGGLNFPIDFSALPDDDEIKKEGSLDEYLAEHPEEADIISGSREDSAELKDVQQLFQQEGFNLPDNFAQSLLDSDLLSKTPEELEQIIRSGGQMPRQKNPADGDEPSSDFSWDIISPDDAAQDETSETPLPPGVPFLDMDAINSDEATRVTEAQRAAGEEIPPQPDFSSLESFHLPDFTSLPEADTLPSGESGEFNRFDEASITVPPFHLSLPGDDEAIPDTSGDASEGSSSENIYGSQEFASTAENEDPFAPFHVKITGENTTPEQTGEPLPAEDDSESEISDGQSEAISNDQGELHDWSEWSFDESASDSADHEEQLPHEETALTEDHTEPTDSFDSWETESDDGKIPDQLNEPPKQERGSLLNTLFGKSTSEKEKNDYRDHLSEDEQSGEYIWDFEKNEFVRLQPGRIEEAIPEKNPEQPERDFTQTLADEPLPRQTNPALTGEFITSDFVWDPVAEEFVRVADESENNTGKSVYHTSEEEDLSAEPEGDIYNFTSPVTTGEVVTSDFVWNPEKEEFVSASEFEPVTPEGEESAPDSASTESDEPSVTFDSFGADQPDSKADLPAEGVNTAFEDFSGTDEDDLFQLPKDFASGNFSFNNDISSVTTEDIPELTTENNSSDDESAEEPETEGGLWDFSDEEDSAQTNSLPEEQINPPAAPELKLPTFNFLDDAPASDIPPATGEITPDALDQVKNWIDKASDHDLMNLLSNMGKTFETIEGQTTEQNSAVIADPALESDNIYNDNEHILRNDMENNSNQENKKSLRSLFKVVSEKPQTPPSSEPENVFDAADAFWGTPEDTTEKESFLAEDSHNMHELSSENDGSNELGNNFSDSDSPAAFVKLNQPDIKSSLKKTAALDSVQMSSDREAGLSVEQLRMIIEAAKTVNSNVKLDEALTGIVVTASNLTKADRGTLYIIDRETDELWSKVMKGEQIEEIRLKIGQGISGWVARSGEILNLKNAYDDPRFDASFDGITGYKTTSMLCYPIKDKHNAVIAVLQLLNSRQGIFTKLDEEMISALSSFIGITIQNADLIDGLVQVDRLNSLGKVANFIISDIKKPILTIKHLAEHLRTKKDLPRDVRSVLKMILDQSIIVGDLILTTLNYSQGKVILNKKLVKINSVLDEILGMLQDAIEHKKVQIFKKYDRDVLVMVDRKELYQAFFQITKNACDAMPGGGKLQVTTKVIDEDGTIEISFKDSGMGIPESVKEKLFEPFFSQGKKNGIGLGLPITEKIIREHGGTITVESQLGDGANFVITIPQVTRIG
ncbi:MAG: hypothetical protein AMXMBFR48_23930 [Ignavibacteriales bacterium]